MVYFAVPVWGTEKKHLSFTLIISIVKISFSLLLLNCQIVKERETA